MKFVLAAAGSGMLMLFSLVFVLADQASANDGPLCGTTAGFLPKFCVSIPLPATVRRDDPIPTTIAKKETVTTPQADIAPRTDVVIEPGASSDVLAPAASFATGSDTQSEPERAALEARALDRVFDIADLRAYARDAVSISAVASSFAVRAVSV